MPLLIFALFIFMSCSPEKAQKKVLSVAVQSKVRGFDPAQTSDHYAASEVSKVYETLFQFDYTKRPYQLVPWLVEEVPVFDPKTNSYTFKVRKGVLFHPFECSGKTYDSLTLDAQDIAYSILRVADQRNSSPGWSFIDKKIVGLNEWRKKQAASDKDLYDEMPEGLSIEGELKLNVKLNEPFPQFLSLFSNAMYFFAVVSPENASCRGSEFLNYPVGTGPFLLPRFYQEGRIQYQANQEYWARKNPPSFIHDKQNFLGLEGIETEVLVEKQPAWFKFQKGKLDWLEIKGENYKNAFSPGEGLKQELKKKGIEVISQNALDISYVAFNHDDPLFKNNKKLRQALAAAVNKTRMNESFYFNQATPAQSIIPPGLKGHDSELKSKYLVYDLELAKKLLAEAGYPEGRGLGPLDYHAPVGTTSRQIGEAFQSDMRKIGVEVTLHQHSWPRFLDKQRRGELQLFAISWLADYPDAQNFFQLLYGPNKKLGTNASNYDDKIFNSMFEKVAVMSDSPERTALYREMNAYLAEEMPWIFMFHRKDHWLVWPWVKNLQYTHFPHGIEKFLSIDLNQKKKMLEAL